MSAFDPNKSKAKAREALLELAQSYKGKKGMIQHAIEAYKEAIVADPDSEEADGARDGLIKIAQGAED